MSIIKENSRKLTSWTVQSAVRADLGTRESKPSRVCNEPDFQPTPDILTDIYRENLLRRKILLNGVVDDTCLEKVVMQLEKFNQEDDDCSSEGGIVGYDRRSNPITLYINSPGGLVTEGLAVISAIQQSLTPVITVAQGLAASMGFLILCSGHVRFAYRHSLIMAHSIANWQGYAQMQGHIENVDLLRKMQRMMDGIIVDRTKITQQKLDEVYKTKFDWYMTSEEAKSWGIIDEIVPMGLELPTVKEVKKVGAKKAKKGSAE